MVWERLGDSKIRISCWILFDESAVHVLFMSRYEDQSYLFILFIYIPVFPPKTIFNMFPTGERFSDFHKTQQTFKQLVIYHRKLENVDTILMKKILLEVSI